LASDKDLFIYNTSSGTSFFLPQSKFLETYRSWSEYHIPKYHTSVELKIKDVETGMTPLGIKVHVPVWVVWKRLLGYYKILYVITGE